MLMSVQWGGGLMETSSFKLCRIGQRLVEYVVRSSAELEA